MIGGTLPSMSPKFSPPSPPFIAARNHGGSQVPKAVVMHATVSSDDKGTARNIAEWWNGPTSPMSSAHYVRDPKETIQCVGDHTVAYHCGFNTGSIGYELCDEQTGPAKRWDDVDSRAILRGAARDVAKLCLTYSIEVKRPTIAELKAKGPHGIYGHDDSRLAFGGTTHTDPRDFPWARFLGLVRAQVALLKAEDVIATKRKRFKILHAPLHGATATVVELSKALGRPGVVSVGFSEASQHVNGLRRRPRWRITTGPASKRDVNGRKVAQDVAIATKRKGRRNLQRGTGLASRQSTPLRIAPERWIAWTVDMLNGKALAHISLHPNAVVRDQKDWESDRGEKYRDAMKVLFDTVITLREVYGDDLDIVVTGDLQYRQADPKRKWSPKDVFERLDLSYFASGIDWVAFSDGLRLVNSVIVPVEVNGQDHPWLEGTFERI